MTALELAQQLDPSAVAAWVGHPYDVGTIGEDVVALGWMPDAVRDLLAADSCMPGAGRVYVRRPLPLLTQTDRH